MKISIALTLLILAIGGLLGWQDHQRLVVVRTSHDKLVAEAAVAGIVVDAASPDDGVRVTKRKREDKEAVARQTAADFIAFARKIEAVEKEGGKPNEEMQQDILDFMDRMMALDASQLKILIAEFRATPDLKDETRRGLIGFSIMTLANDHPQAALTLFTESSDLLDNGMGKHVISSSLAKWAKDDPMAALEWARANGEKHPDLVTDDAKRGIIAGAAANDPKLAFSLIGELGLKNPSDGIRNITDAARTPAERTATLAALLEYVATLPEGNEKNNAEISGISQLAQGAAKEGFEAGTKWFEEAAITPEQLEKIGGSLSHSVKSAETGKWVEWIGGKMPAGKSSDAVRGMVSRWTRDDYQAAGTWLATAPAGPAKETSVRTYAETVAEYEPETAAQWALTLPAGKQREATLKNIYQRWPKNDETSRAAADAFARQHGIK